MVSAAMEIALQVFLISPELFEREAAGDHLMITNSDIQISRVELALMEN